LGEVIVEQPPDPVVDGDDGAGAWEIDRPVPPSGNVSVGPQQFWFGPHRAGELLTFWIDTTTVHVSSHGMLLKTLPSRLSSLDLTRLARAGAREAGPPPARRLPGLLHGDPVELDRVVNAVGVISIADQKLHAGSPLAGQRITIRLDGQLAHIVLHDGTLQILDDQDEILTTVPRTNNTEVTRHKAYRHTVNQT
jgi:hypothetical protein